MTPKPTEPAPVPLLAGVFVVALALRIVWHLTAHPVDWPDTAVYIADGNSLFAHGMMKSYLYMPLYPVLIHVLGPDGVLWLQAPLSAATAVLAAVLAFELFASVPAAAAAGLLAAFHPLLIFYADMRLSETVFTFLELAGLVALYRGRWWLGATALVLGILTRPALDLVAPLIVLSFGLLGRAGGGWRQPARGLAIYAVVYLVLMTPWWLHNWEKYGHFVRLDLDDGIVMRLENNSVFDRVGLDFGAFRSVLDFPEIKDPVALDDARKAAAFRYIVDHPLHYLWRCIERLGRFWTPLPGSRHFGVELVACVASVTIYLGLVLSLLKWRVEWRRLLPVLLPILFLTAVHAATHALPRYRLPLEPLFAALAGGWYGPALAAAAARLRRPRSAGPPNGIEA